jgi:acetaldehyde dehydrogenase/alcohol dehydrogenase
MHSMTSVLVLTALISELKQILLDTYYGREFKEGDVAAVKTEALSSKLTRKRRKALN